MNRDSMIINKGELELMIMSLMSVAIGLIFRANGHIGAGRFDLAIEKMMKANQNMVDAIDKLSRLRTVVALEKGGDNNENV